MDLIPVISMYQPWASWVMLGWKTTETRLHNRFAKLSGKTIIIHASQNYDRDAIHEAWKYRLGITDTLKHLGTTIYPTGLLGIAYVEKTRELTMEDSDAALIDCGIIRRYGLFLQYPIPFSKPILMKGGQGIFYVRKEKDTYIKVIKGS